jgi:hypothetical protein
MVRDSSAIPAVAWLKSGLSARIDRPMPAIGAESLPRSYTRRQDDVRVAPRHTALRCVWTGPPGCGSPGLTMVVGIG